VIITREQILAKVRAIESTYGTRVLYAVESGSRAWGFASPDSDYDVRFIYVRRPRDLLGVFEPRDVIEEMDGDLDVSGWDIRKALGLFLKTNPPLYEWLDSPIIYVDDGVLAPALRALASQFFSKRACFHHYRAMSENNWRAYLQGETVRLKKYLYVLRPVLGADWILERGIMPPTEFAKLLDAASSSSSSSRLPSDVRAEIDALLEKKKGAAELADGPRLPALHAFLGERIEKLRDLDPPQTERVDPAPLDALMRETLWRVWPNASDWQ